MNNLGFQVIYQIPFPLKGAFEGWSQGFKGVLTGWSQGLKGVLTGWSLG